MIRGFQRKKEKKISLSGRFSHSFKRMRMYGVAAVDWCKRAEAVES